jgi:hypothetical protein
MAWHLPVFLGVAAGTLCLEGVGPQHISLPLVNQEDVIDFWFAGQVQFGTEHEQTGGRPFRTANWKNFSIGNCSIKDAEVAITKDGNVSFSARVKSKDDGDTYCVILRFFDQSQSEVWSSSKLCTPFELRDEYGIWKDTSASFRKSDYGFISFATREDHC